jgi:glutathione synthase/RimK-type ligase-like ATP-grasp enzyme
MSKVNNDKIPFGMLWREQESNPLPQMEITSYSRKNLNKRNKRNTVVIVTSQFDPHSDAVISALDVIGVESLRINSEDLLNHYTFTWQSNSTNYTSIHIHEDPNLEFQVPQKIFSGYYRTPSQVKPHQELTSEIDRKFSVYEGEAFLECLYGLGNISWISPPHLIGRAESKILQLQLARSLGLKIPRTILTNNPKEALHFAQSCKFNVITKPLTASTLDCQGSFFEVYAHQLDESTFKEHFESIRFAPTLLQEYIPKALEIRVTIIGTDFFATQIDSQSVSGAEIDWRKIDCYTIPHKPVTLPRKLVAALKQFIGFYGIQFGAIDLILTPDKEYFFLENNPNGQWYWLEVLTGQPMAISMAKLLKNQSKLQSPGFVKLKSFQN